MLDEVFHNPEKIWFYRPWANPIELITSFFGVNYAILLTTNLSVGFYAKIYAKKSFRMILCNETSFIELK